MEETKICEQCQQAFPVNKHGFLTVPFFALHSSTCTHCGKSFNVTFHEDGRLSYCCPGHTSGMGPTLWGFSPRYCPYCRDAQRKNNRQAYPLCPMCQTPTKVSNFLREYQGYRLDIIRVCCTNCIPAFEALPEHTQRALLRSAMVAAYGETAVIYALQYDTNFPYHHIGRTKRLPRRMAEYRRKWYKDIHAYHVLEELPFGPLSMERECRWLLHALKHAWPIDNFDMFTPERHPRPPEGIDVSRAYEQHTKTFLTAAVAAFEPLTAPFEMIEPLLSHFGNTRDVPLVHWMLEHSTE